MLQTPAVHHRSHLSVVALICVGFAVSACSKELAGVGTAVTAEASSITTTPGPAASPAPTLRRDMTTEAGDVAARDSSNFRIKKGAFGGDVRREKLSSANFVLKGGLQ